MPPPNTTEDTETMCQICEDFMEFDRAVDAYIAEQLPKMMAPVSPEDRALLEGRVDG